MPAFVIVQVTVTDPQRYEDYKKLSTAAVAAYGGKFLARGGQVETLEGDWDPQRLVIIEFESVARAKEWLDSPEYSPARQIRHATARSLMIVVQGV